MNSRRIETIGLKKVSDNRISDKKISGEFIQNDTYNSPNEGLNQGY